MGSGAGARLRALRAHLNGALFAEAPSTEPAIGGWRLAMLVAALLALAVVLQLLRLGWSAPLDTVWAEDGPVFLQNAITHGLGSEAFATYAGYLVLVPRLIAAGAALLPLRDAAAAISILSAGVVALSGLAVWLASAAHIRDPYLRGGLAVLAVLVPVAGQESVDASAYVSWYMLFATFWLLLWRPRTPWGTALSALFVLMTALSTPGIWFFLPVAVLRAIAARDGRDLAIVGSYAAGAAVQGLVVAINTEETVAPAWSHDIWAAFLQRVVDGAALGLRLGGVAWSHLGWPFLFALGICALAGFAAGLRRSNASARWIALICLLTSFALFVVSIYQRALGPQVVWPADNYSEAAARYAIVPALLLVSAALVLLEGTAARRRRSGRSLATLAAVAVLALGVVTSFDLRHDSARESPKWGEALAQAAASCDARHAAEVTIPTTPAGWGVVLPCEEVAPAVDSERRR